MRRWVNVDCLFVIVVFVCSYDCSDWVSVFVNVEQEFIDVVLMLVCGVVFVEFQGMFYCNGFGCFEWDGYCVYYFFDGDGMIVVMWFENGSVCFSNCFVCIEGWLVEEKVGQVFY